MTYHSSFEYKCPSCGLEYAPFRRGVKCPRCGNEPKEVYDMVSEALEAWFYHVGIYGRGTPHAYIVLSLGDHYIYLSCIFLDLYVRELLEGEVDSEGFIRSFLASIDFKGHEYLVDHYKEYFSDLLERFDKVAKEDKWAAQLVKCVENLVFFEAVEEGDLAKVKKYLERGASVAVRDRYGYAPLHIAALHGNVEVAKLLLESGADINAKDRNGETPLHLVTKVDVARLLVESGADIDARDEDGHTPLHTAAMSNSVEVAELLLEKGADVNARDIRGATPLHWASDLCKVRVASLLLEKGADVNARDERGETPLHLAALKGYVDIVELLVKHGSNVNARDNNGDTPLHLAASKGTNTLFSEIGLSPSITEGCNVDYVSVVRLLLESGADPSIRNNEGKTALDIARQLIHEDIVTAIEEYARATHKE